MKSGLTAVGFSYLGRWVMDDVCVGMDDDG